MRNCMLSACMILLEIRLGTSNNQGACETCHCVKGESDSSVDTGIWSLGYSGLLYEVAVAGLATANCLTRSHKWIITNSTTSYKIILTVSSRGCFADTTDNGPYSASCSAASSGITIMSTISVNNLDVSQNNSVSFSSDCADPKQCARWTFSVKECSSSTPSCENSAIIPETISNPCGDGCTAKFRCANGYYNNQSSTTTCQADATWENNCKPCTAVTCPKANLIVTCDPAEDPVYFNTTVNCDDSCETAILTCTANGSWDLSSYQACASVTCPKANLTVTCDPAEDPVYFNTTVNCDDSCETAIVTCTANGSWDLSSYQACASDPQPQNNGATAGMAVGSVIGVRFIGGLVFYVVK